MPLDSINAFVWEKWRTNWYMGRIVELQIQDSEQQHPPSSALTTAQQVKIHIHGEPVTTDKWFPLTTENLIPLAIVVTPLTAIGVLPTRGDFVRLLVMDEPLFDLISNQNLDEKLENLTLMGTVVQVLPARDASLVDVFYPTSYLSVQGTRRVQISNGYIQTVSEPEFHTSIQYLERVLHSSSSNHITQRKEVK